MPESKAPASSGRPEMCSGCSAHLLQWRRQLLLWALRPQSSKGWFLPFFRWEPIGDQRNDHSNSDIKISETETLEPSQNYQSLPPSPSLAITRVFGSLWDKEGSCKISTSSATGMPLSPGALFGSMQWPHGSYSPEGCFRFHHSRTGEASSVPWDISTSREGALICSRRRGWVQVPLGWRQGPPADPSQSSFTGLLKKDGTEVLSESHLAVRSRTVRGQAWLCDLQARLVPPLHPLLRIATAEGFQRPCWLPSFFFHGTQGVSCG